jgi:hypothetical protein
VPTARNLPAINIECGYVTCHIAAVTSIWPQWRPRLHVVTTEGEHSHRDVFYGSF